MISTARSPVTRRRLLASTGVALLLMPLATRSSARSFSAFLPWEPDAGDYPVPVVADGWHFFTADEAAAVEAIVDRLIPHDDLSVGGREAGCAVYIDRQLAGSFGKSTRLYMRPPFMKGTPQQGMQSEIVPAERYRLSLAALDAYCKQNGDQAFARLAPERQDEILKGLETGKLSLPNVDGKAFFDLVLQTTMEGFFSDPIYGGNRDMAGWRMLGFPGARYDYRDHVSKHNQPYTKPPVSIAGRSDWAARN